MMMKMKRTMRVSFIDGDNLLFTCQDVPKLANLLHMFMDACHSLKAHLHCDFFFNKQSKMTEPKCCEIGLKCCYNIRIYLKKN